MVAKRTIFMDVSKSPIFIAEFARIVTTDGKVMIEQFNPMLEAGGRRIEGDDMNRIDAVEFVDRTRIDNVLSFGEESVMLHGGQATPKG